MSNFEKEYYEFNGFWEEKSLKHIDVERIKNAINLIPTDVKTVLDVGCGNGIFTNKLKEMSRYDFVVGIDRSKAALHYVKTEKILADIGNLPIKSETFDLVVSMEVLEHLPVESLSKAMNEISRVTKKYILISVPNRENIMNNLIQCPKCLTIFNYCYHMRSFDEDNLISLFDRMGFSLLNILSIGEYNSYIGYDVIENISIKIFGYNKTMRNSICPLCGHSERAIKLDDQNNSINKEGIIKNIVKKVWPQKREYMWLMALYEKK